MSESPSEEKVTGISPLNQLPIEIILLVIDQLDNRPTFTPLFPNSPNSALLNFRATSTQFHRLCHSLVWRSLTFAGIDLLDPLPIAMAANVPPSRRFTQRRSLANWVKLVQQSDALIAASDREVPLDRIHITMLQLVMVGQSESKADDLKELEAINLILDRFASSLKVVFLKSIVIGKEEGNAALKTLNEMPLLRTLRLNQCELGSLRTIESLSPFPALRSLQIMHGSKRNFQLVKLTPNLTSLLLWPSSRRLGSLADDVLAMVPTLNTLSLDVVKEPEFISILAQRYIELGKVAQQKSEGPLPLTELFIEAHLSRSAHATLFASFAFIKLQQLALYHIEEATPTLINDIAEACPRLKGLTLVQGTGEASTYWDDHLHSYTTQLAKLRQLTFFAFDRDPNDEYNGDNMPIGFNGRPVKPPVVMDLHHIQGAVPNLREIVIIESDVAEGCQGHVLCEGKVGEMDRLDFLIPFSKWPFEDTSKAYIPPSLAYTLMEMSTTQPSLPSSSPPPSQKETTFSHDFGLLPNELILIVINHLNDPSPCCDFPEGPNSDLLNLRATSTQLCLLCHPLVWRSLSFIGSGLLSAVDDTADRNVPNPNRSLANWVKLVQQSDALIAASPREVPLDRIEVEMLQLVMIGQSGSEADDLKELEAINLILDRFASSLKVVFLKSIVIGKDEGNAALKTLNEMPLLRTLRLNQCELGSLETIESMTPFPALRSLQIMHGSERIFQLVKLTPDLSSLLLWPSSRRIGLLADNVLAMVPRLDMLSLDVVNEPEFISILAQRYIELGQIAQQKSEGPLPLTELFLKGPLLESTRTTLLASFEFVKLKYLALYHTQVIPLTLIAGIVERCPGLEGLE